MYRVCQFYRLAEQEKSRKKACAHRDPGHLVAVAVLSNTIKRTTCIINLKYQVTQKYLKYKRLLSFSYHKRCLYLWVRAILTFSIHFHHDGVTDTDYTASSSRMTDDLETKLEESGGIFFWRE